jgi:hypothetical protein
MPSVLCVGGDAELLETRAAVLRDTGSEVQCTLSSLALAVIESRSFDLVVLCHSVRQDEAKQFYEAAHRRLATTQVLRLNRVRGWLAGSDCKSSDREVNTDPATVVRAAAELLGKHELLGKQGEAGKSDVRGA